MRWAIIIVCAAVLGLLGLMAVIGLFLPRRHVASRRATFNQSIDELWRALTDFANEPSWRTDLKAKRQLADREGQAVWHEEHFRGWNLTLQIVELTPPHATDAGRAARMITRLADEKLPFSGTWTYELQSTSDGGCTITITEDGEVSNPIFRFLAHLVISHHSVIDRYLRMLARKYGQQAMIVTPPKEELSTAVR